MVFKQKRGLKLLKQQQKIHVKKKSNSIFHIFLDCLAQTRGDQGGVILGIPNRDSQKLHFSALIPLVKLCLQ